jgi:murein tripeptide amidase MpaA
MFAEGLKHSIVHGSENPHNKNYLVNAKIHIENDKIKAYTVLDVIDSYDDENGELETELFT